MDRFAAGESMNAGHPLRPADGARHAMLVWLLGPATTAAWMGACVLVVDNHLWESLPLLMFAVVFVVYGNVCALFASVLLFTRGGAWRLPETWSLAAYWAALTIVITAAATGRGDDAATLCYALLVPIAAGPLFALGRLLTRSRIAASA